MVAYYSQDYLRKMCLDLFSNKSFDEQYYYHSLCEIFKKEKEYLNANCNTTLLILIDLLENSNYNTPRLHWISNQIKNCITNIVFASIDDVKGSHEPLDEMMIAVKKDLAQKEKYCDKEESCKKKDHCDSNNKKLSPEDLKELFLSLYKRFTPGPDNNIVLPPKGEIGYISLRDNMTIPGKTYNMRFVIDDQGNVLRMDGFPLEKKSNADYESLYAGMIGQVMQYQQVED